MTGRLASGRGVKCRWTGGGYGCGSGGMTCGLGWEKFGFSAVVTRIGFGDGLVCMTRDGGWVVGYGHGWGRYTRLFLQSLCHASFQLCAVKSKYFCMGQRRSINPYSSLSRTLYEGYLTLH